MGIVMLIVHVEQYAMQTTQLSIGNLAQKRFRKKTRKEKKRISAVII